VVTPVKAFVNGAAGAAGAYAMNEYGIPAAKKTAEKIVEVVHNHGNGILSSGLNAGIGGAHGGPVGAGIFGFIGWLSGSEEDQRAATVLENGGQDERCVVQ